MLFKKSNNKLITFTNVQGVSDFYKPIPASKVIPEWYKKMGSFYPKEKVPTSTPTIKKCIPVLDAITAGYIIVSPCDVYVSFKEGSPDYNSAIKGLIAFHPVKQAHLHPRMNEHPFPKWINPWGIKTPKGYSCLFVPPMHNPNPYFVILEGIVDTDEYITPINFPFVLKNPEKECLIPAGTPIAQVIPFKRDVWEAKHSSREEDIKESHKLNDFIDSHFFDRYKRFKWTRKMYQ
jgi:hypothetical protein